jgi:FkbM family methyltransferase
MTGLTRRKKSLMLTKIAQSVYSAYLAELRQGSAGNPRRRTRLRRARRFLLKLGDPDIIAPLDGFGFQTPFSSNILLSHFELPFYDCVLPRLARAVRAARGGLVMLDIGANIGAATYLVSRETSGRFLCVEANPRFQASLTHNLAQIPRSRARFVALTDEKRRIAVKHNYAEGNSNIEPSPQGGEWLEFTTLDELLGEEADFRAPHLVKIDTEGFELRILRGATRLLDSVQPVLFCEFFPAFIRREGGDPDALFTLLRQHGYDRFIFYDGAGNLLTSAEGGQTEQLQSLRRYCDLRHSFFDVAAFPAAAAALSRSFEASERDFFEKSLHPDSPIPPPHE